ncbi:MAG: hypothetical protein AAF542_05755 [Pseudomonadota bacterium]
MWPITAGPGSVSSEPAGMKHIGSVLWHCGRGEPQLKQKVEDQPVSNWNFLSNSSPWIQNRWSGAAMATAAEAAPEIFLHIEQWQKLMLVSSPRISYFTRLQRQLPW